MNENEMKSGEEEVVRKEEDSGAGVEGGCGGSGAEAIGAQIGTFEGGEEAEGCEVIGEILPDGRGILARYVITNGTAAIAALRPWEGNPNVMTAAELEKLRRSIREFGFVDPVIVRKEDGLVIGGHQRLTAAAAEGLDIVPVRWIEGIDDAHARALNVALNKIGGTLDQDKLGTLLRELTAGGMDAMLTGFEQSEIDEILAALETTDFLTDPDEIPAPPDEAMTRRGDLWLLGNHRLLCGDCTTAADVDTLMQDGLLQNCRAAGILAKLCVTDPPWNVAYYASKDGKPSRAAMANDNLGRKFGEFVKRFCRQIKRVLYPGAALYMVMGAKEWPLVHSILDETDFHWGTTIIWLKDSFVLTRQDYHSQYEPIWCGIESDEALYDPIYYGWQGGAGRLQPVKDRKQSNVWPLARPIKSPLHPTTKPVELMARMIRNSSKPGDVVFEPFAGSGSTLIACEMERRRCYAIELEPHYCDVIVTRWEKFTGKKAVVDRRG